MIEIHYRYNKLNIVLKNNNVSTFKGLVHPKMEISLCITHPLGILGVYDFLLSDESSWSYIKNGPAYPKCYHCSQPVFLLNNPQDVK